MSMYTYRSFFSRLEFLVGSKHHLRLLITEYALKKAQTNTQKIYSSTKKKDNNTYNHTCMLTSFATSLFSCGLFNWGLYFHLDKR